jgi:glycine/D-amino acid oxidase-like deaminating enzyme
MKCVGAPLPSTRVRVDFRPEPADPREERLIDKRIVVVGGGVLGTTSALALALGGADVVLYADEMEATTSAYVSGGLIEPYASADERVGDWFGRTLRALEMLAAEHLHGWATLHAGILFSTEPLSVLPEWSQHIPMFENPARSPVDAFPFASRYETLTLRSDHLMATLNRLARRAGVSFERRWVQDLESLVASEQPDAVVAAAGLGMGALWPDPCLAAGVGLVRVVDIPPPGRFSWLDAEIDALGLDVREVILMNADVTAYSIPRRSNRPGWAQLVIGGTNVIQAPGAPVRVDDRMISGHQRNVEAGLPPLFSSLIDRVEGEWRCGARPLRDHALLETKEVGGVPVLGLGGVGGSGMSVFVGVVEDGIDILLDGCMGSSARMSPV